MNLLIVDDHPGIRDALARLLPVELSVAGHLDDVRVLAAASADHAVAIAQAVAIDVAILDVDLGRGDDGVQIAGLLLELRPGLRIVFHTGLPMWRPPAELCRWPVLAKGEAIEQLVGAILSTAAALPG